MEILVVFAVIIALIAAYACANNFYEIACMKGHDDRKYFWWTFFIPLMGALMVIALPEKKQVDKEMPVATPANERKESFTAACSTPAVVETPKIASVVTPCTTENEDQIECPVCGKRQRANRTVCWECGAKFNKE